MTVDIFRDCHVAMFLAMTERVLLVMTVSVLLAMTVGVLLVITVRRNDSEGGVRGVRRLWFCRGRL